MLFIVNQPTDVSGTLSLKWSKNFASNLNNNLLLAQKEVDKDCIKLMKPYTPFKIGVLENSATIHTVIGSGEIKQITPYARYLYYGKVYGPNFPIVQERDGTKHIVFGHYDGDGIIIGWRSPKGKKKHPTGRDIQYRKDNKHPLAGKMWFERMKADRKGEILQAAAKILGSNAK
uniref:Minor capsid protein n=1 Tax=Siphoviridae sp. ctvFN21 TaxID=2826511 RepID=A0A8S5R0G7_9CAUD|nr:MAG TPA: Minor capsid protein [Siphoviridae sp. ctvFN21]